MLRRRFRRNELGRPCARSLCPEKSWSIFDIEIDPIPFPSGSSRRCIAIRLASFLRLSSSTRLARRAGNETRYTRSVRSLDPLLTPTLAVLLLTTRLHAEKPRRKTADAAPLSASTRYRLEFRGTRAGFERIRIGAEHSFERLVEAFSRWFGQPRTTLGGERVLGSRLDKWRPVPASMSSSDFRAATYG